MISNCSKSTVKHTPVGG